MIVSLERGNSTWKVTRVPSVRSFMTCSLIYDFFFQGKAVAALASYFLGGDAVSPTSFRGDLPVSFLELSSSAVGKKHFS